MTEKVAYSRGAGESDEALADVAGREDAEFVAELTGGTAVICHADDGGDFCEVVFQA